MPVHASVSRASHIHVFQKKILLTPAEATCLFLIAQIEYVAAKTHMINKFTKIITWLADMGQFNTGVSVMIKLQLLGCLYDYIMIMITHFFKSN